MSDEQFAEMPEIRTEYSLVNGQLAVALSYPEGDQWVSLAAPVLLSGVLEEAEFRSAIEEAAGRCRRQLRGIWLWRRHPELRKLPDGV